MHLVAKSNSPGPASPSIWSAQAPEKPNPRPNYWWLRRVRLAEGACEKKAPGSSRTQIRTCQADGRNCLLVAALYHHGAAWNSLVMPVTHARIFFFFLVLKPQVRFVSHPPSLERGFYFPLFSYGMQLLRLFCQVEK